MEQILLCLCTRVLELCYKTISIVISEVAVYVETYPAIISLLLHLPMVYALYLLLLTLLVHLNRLYQLHLLLHLLVALKQSNKI